MKEVSDKVIVILVIIAVLVSVIGTYAVTQMAYDVNNGDGGQQSFSPEPNQQYTFTWDGLDAYDRIVYGTMPAMIKIGYTYDEIDALLHYLIDLRYSEEMLVDLGFSTKMVRDIQKRIQIFQFKRRPPIIAKLSNRTINQDFRYCRDWGV